jgi:hypothetical protein
MFKEIYKVIYFIIILIFVYLLFAIYFSEENIKKIKKNHVNIENSFKDYLSNLPILENDTNDVITYNSNKFLEKKIKKRKFWKLLKKNE